MAKRLLAALITFSLLLVGVGCAATVVPTPSPTPSAPDPYVGEWRQPVLHPNDGVTTISVKRSGDVYAIGPSGQGMILHTQPNSSGQVTLKGLILDSGATATPEGEGLLLRHAGETYQISVRGDTMTWSTPPQLVFEFERVGTKS
jgi:hypothetical protein